MPCEVIFEVIMQKWVFINEDFIQEEKASLHFKDLSFLRGYGIFDFFRLIKSEPLFLEDHLNRFYFSADGMHLPVPFQRQELKTIIYELIKKNNLPDTGIRLGLTGGYSEDGFTIAKPNFIISQHTVTPPTPAQREHGIKLLSCNYQRQLHHVKTIDYLNAIRLQPLLNEKGFDDLLYLSNGSVTECPRSNFFIVTMNDEIITPATGMLKGITRMKILELAKQHFIVEEREINFNEVRNAKEAFITSTTKQILPVAQIDDVVFKETKISKQLLQLVKPMSPA